MGKSINYSELMLLNFAVLSFLLTRYEDYLLSIFQLPCNLGCHIDILRTPLDNWQTSITTILASTTEQLNEHNNYTVVRAYTFDKPSYVAVNIAIKNVSKLHETPLHSFNIYNIVYLPPPPSMRVSTCS